MNQVFGSTIPAPNPTGELHLGHVLNLTVQDIFCRWNSLKGLDLYWAGALDHGTTITETITQRRLSEAGVDTSNWNKGDWVRAVNEWIDYITPKIYKQIHHMNLIMDIDEIRCMRDKGQRVGCQRLIEELERANLLYRARVVFPWCPRKKTYVDKAETSLESRQVQEYSVRYVDEVDPNRTIDIWIERPETLLNDIALIVSSQHPLAGDRPRQVITPLGLKIPLITEDEFFEEKAVAAVARVTPGHCARSFRWARHNKLPIHRVFDEDSIMEVGEYKGQTRAEAAQQIVVKVRDSGRLMGTRTRETSQVIYRLSDGPVEDFLTEQCLVESEKMAEGALELLRKGEIRIHPPMYKKALEVHLEAIVNAKRTGASSELADDWCISQQTAWGNDLKIDHIPYLAERGAEYAKPTREVEPVVPFKIADALWPFYVNRVVYSLSEDEVQEVAKSSICVTGVDLVLYWIEPIIMLSTVLKQGIAVRDVIIHPLICDAQGRKMSKSLGNVVAPDEMWERYGSDALRFALLQSLDLSQGKMNFGESYVRKAKKLLDEVEKSLQNMKQQTEQAGGALPLQRIDEQDIFTDLDQAMTQFDIKSTMNHVNRLLQMIVAQGNSLDVQRSRQLLSLAALLEPFAPELVGNLGFSRSANAKRVRVPTAV